MPEEEHFGAVIYSQTHSGLKEKPFLHITHCSVISENAKQFESGKD